MRLLTMLGPVMSRKFDPSVAYCKLGKMDIPSAREVYPLWPSENKYIRSFEVPFLGKLK